jgi:hypothetical protein
MTCKKPKNPVIILALGASVLIEALMPGVRHIALRDYAALNDTPIEARAALSEAEE